MEILVTMSKQELNRLEIIKKLTKKELFQKKLLYILILA